MSSTHRVHHRSTRIGRRAIRWGAALSTLFMVVAVLGGAFSANAVERRSKSAGRPLKLGEFNPTDASVEMFEAIEKGQIAVKFIPKDSTQARVFITNKTNKPLNVKLPEAFAAVPVLAQMGGMGGGGMGGGGGGGGGQGMGGGMGGGGMGGGGMGGGGMGGGGGGGGFFNVPAEKVGNFKVPCLCLEHGKPEPRPAMAYKLIPIGEFSTKPGVAELCKLLGYGRVNQRAAQAAAWNLNNDMSWQELAGKEIKRLDGSRYPYFTNREMQAALNIAFAASQMAEDAEQQAPVTPSPGETAENARK